MTYPVIVHKGESTKGYWVECPTLRGCYSQGKSVEDALKNIREAIELCVEDEEPAPVGSVSFHLVTV